MKIVKKFVKTIYKNGNIDINQFNKYSEELFKITDCEKYNIDDIKIELCRYVSIDDKQIKFHKKKKDIVDFITINNLENDNNYNYNVFLKKKIIKPNNNYNNINKNIINSNCDNNNNVNNNNNINNNNNVNNNNNNNINNNIIENIRNTMMTDDLYLPHGTQWINDIQKDDIIDDQSKLLTEKYTYLSSLTFPPQKSIEWHNSRRNRITASDGGCVLGENPYEEQYKFVVKKVLEPEFQYNKNCYHGNKYEESATSIYEYRMNVKVTEFGLIEHPTIYYLAASPDGIISPYKYDNIHLTKYVGRMLEIKCPVEKGREIVKNGPETGSGKNVQCPKYYWIQVQLQLECCDLDECDFWQCKIIEYKDYNDFINDSDNYRQFLSKTKMEKIVVIQLLPKKFGTDGEDDNMDYDNKVYKYSKFIYPPKLEMTHYELDIWLYKTINGLETTHPDYVLDCVKYGKLEQTHNTLIKRDKKWFNDNLPKMRKIWNYVEYLRSNKKHCKILMNYIKSLPELKWYEKENREKRNNIIMKYYEIISGNNEKEKKDLLHKLKI
jgi:putative phage-type endonuclease